jgi:hypothetical protein
VVFELTILVVIGTDDIGSCKSNYDTITTTTAPELVHYQKTLKTVWCGKYLVIIFIEDNSLIIVFSKNINNDVYRNAYR